MNHKITIAYVTGRANPRWEWFVDSLLAQTTPAQQSEIQLVFIDGNLWAPMESGCPYESIMLNRDRGLLSRDRLDDLSRIIGGRISYLHTPPKPCAWQGPFRQTKVSWFCAGNARNTAFIVANAPYVVFVDDLSVLGPQWFNQVQHAAQDQYIVAGAYRKVKKLKVVSGRIDSFEEFHPGVDSRWDRGSDGGVVPWHGSALYGCSFGLPLEAALEVDGNDAACNGQGAEDTDFGIRLERAGWPFFYNRNMLTLESEELHHDGSKLPMGRRIVTPDRLPPGYDTIYRHANPAEKYQSDHVMLNRLMNEHDRVLPLIGDDLRTLRARYQATGLVPVPAPGMIDWRDGTPLSEI